MHQRRSCGISGARDERPPTVGSGTWFDFRSRALSRPTETGSTRGVHDDRWLAPSARGPIDCRVDDGLELGLSPSRQRGTAWL